MISVDYQQAELLFSRFDLRATLEATREAAVKDAAAAPVDGATSDVALDQIVATLADKHSITVPSFREDNIYATQERRQVDVSGDWSRSIFDRSQPAWIEFEALVFHVPYEGERELFFGRASTFSLNPPRAEVDATELRIALTFEGEVTPDQLRAAFDTELGRVRTHLGYVATEVGTDWDGRVRQLIRDTLEANRNRRASTQNLVAGLGLNTPPQPPASSSVLRARTATPTPAEPLREQRYEHDFFISHASEDKDAVARPLYERLSQSYRVWFDEAEIRIGDSLVEKIDEGLRTSRFGIVIMSQRFFQKQWTSEELRSFRARRIAEGGSSILLPVWVDIDDAYLREHHPPLADLMAVRWSDGVDSVAAAIEAAYGG